MSFYDLLAAKLLLFQIIETLFIIIQRKNHEDTSCRANKLGTRHRRTRWAIVITAHIFIYIGLCYATELVMTKKYIIDFLAFSLLKKQKTSPSGLNLV